MLRRFGSVILLVTLLSFSFVVYSTPNASADIANMYSLEVGGTMTNSSNLIMPEVDTHIRIVRARFSITVTSNFYIVSNQTVNASLAFVYPEAWSSFYPANQPNFTIRADNLKINYTVETYENLTANGFNFQNSDLGGDWCTRAEYVCFNLEMIENQTYLINIRTIAHPLVDNYGGFSYIIGSARTFAGETHQTIEMLVIEEEPFVNFGFSPDYYLTESSNETGTIAFWDIIINESLNFSAVVFNFTIKEYHGNPPPIPFPWAIYAGLGIVVVILGSGLIIRRRMMN